MENTKNAVSIEVLLQIMEEEENKAYLNFQRSCQNLGHAKFEGNKKYITIYKKEMKQNSIKFSAISQAIFNIKTKGGIL
jgi:hypothetical protein